MKRTTRANVSANINNDTSSDNIVISQKKLEQIIQKSILKATSHLQEELRNLRRTIEQLCNKTENDNCVKQHEMEINLESDDKIDELNSSTDSTDATVMDTIKTEQRTSDKRNYLDAKTHPYSRLTTTRENGRRRRLLSRARE